MEYLVSDDHRVGTHCLKVERGVGKSFAFLYCASGNCDIVSVGAETLFGDFKRCSRSGRRLSEEVDDRFAFQRQIKKVPTLKGKEMSTHPSVLA